jgi:toxin HigB-1
MIKSWKHKGLKKFFEHGSTEGIQVKHAKRLRVQLGLLHAATQARDMDIPGYKFHMLTGNRKGCYSILVNANWRLTFYFVEKDALLVNYEDYH